MSLRPNSPPNPPLPLVGPLLTWARRNLFSSWISSLVTLAIGALLAAAIPPVYAWALGHAVFVPDVKLCRAAQGEGACWGFVTEKARLILFGRYPYAEQWRPLVATLILGGALFISCFRRFWKTWLAALWTAALLVFVLLMTGGFWGMSHVETNLWGGFPLTLVLTVVGIFLALPLAILIALGRRSNMPIIRSFCIFYVEIIRGVPLITVLFTASFLFPLFLPPEYNIDVMLRIQIGIVLFTAAYLAETIRGGLQAIPKGQYHAASALGLGYWQATGSIILPQALRIVVAPMVNTFISTFMDTSLVMVVSLYDLTGALKLALGDPSWKPFFREGYLFVGAIYLVCCYGMSRYSQWVERHINRRISRP